MSHDAGAAQSIRAQAKQGKQQQKQRKQGEGGTAVDRATADKTVVKAVLANPLTVPWPSIPRHLQATILANLPSFIPGEIPEYHTGRARCHVRDKRKKRTQERATAIKAAHAAAEESARCTESGQVIVIEAGEQSQDVDRPTGRPSADDDIEPDEVEPKAVSDERLVEGASRSDIKSKSKRPHPPNTQISRPRSERPAALDHLVLGINEVIKALERQTDELRIRVMEIGHALSEQQHVGQKRKRRGGHALQGRTVKNGGRELLPTAPLADEEEDEEEAIARTDGGEVCKMTKTQRGQAGPNEKVGSVGGTPAEESGSLQPRISTPSGSAPLNPLAPLEWIVLPLASISPQGLVSPIPAYCATYNTLVYQHTHISKIARTRLTKVRADEVIGVQAEEVRVVPLGKVEEEMAALVGLRRLACLGIRAGHPKIDVIRALLPKSILHPPRHSLTLPFPTSALTIHSGPPSTPGARTGNPQRPERSPTAAAAAPAPGPAKHDKAVALLPHVHYAPLHVKGITTTIPADGNARKQKRMEEVRAKRQAAKERRKLERRKAA